MHRERKWGHNVVESFYAQHQLEALHLDNTILDEMKTCGSQMTEQELRNLLGCFLFGGDDIDKKIRILSGGEKARVALAKTIISKANFLLLDEPTNHLDMHSCDLLIESLNKYQGTYILVSHDRHFISKTANKIWEIVDHEIKEFKGGYEEYVQWKERMTKSSAAEAISQRSKKPDKNETISKPAAAKEGNPPPPPSAARGANKELQKQQKLFQQLEEKIAVLNKKKTELEAALADPATYSDKQKFLEIESLYKETSVQLELLNTQYETVFNKIMELE